MSSIKDKFQRDVRRICSDHDCFELFRKHFEAARDIYSEEEGWTGTKNQSLLKDAYYPIFNKYEWRLSKISNIDNIPNDRGNHAFKNAFKRIKDVDREDFKPSKGSEYAIIFLMWMCWRTPQHAIQLYDALNALVGKGERAFEFKRLFDNGKYDEELELSFTKYDANGSHETVNQNSSLKNWLDDFLGPNARQNIAQSLVSTFLAKIASGLLLIFLALAAYFQFGSNLSFPWMPPQEEVPETHSNEEQRPSEPIQENITVDDQPEGIIPEQSIDDSGATNETIERRDSKPPEQVVSTEGPWDDVSQEIWDNSDETFLFRNIFSDIDEDQLLSAAHLGNPNAMVLTSIGAELGLLTNHRLDTVGEYLEPACSSNHSLGCYLLAHAYRDDPSRINRRQLAQIHFTRACNLGSNSACFESGLNQVHDSDSSEARLNGFEKVRKACDAGYSLACTQAGRLLEKGEWMEKDQSKAAEYFAKGCELGATERCD